MKELFYDTERMLLANSDLISRHPAHLYYSVLPFLPSDTYLARKYPAPRDCISVLTGRENSWPPSLFKVTSLYEGSLVTLAPGGHMFAVGDEDRIQIYNASNGLLNSSIGSMATDGHYYPNVAAFTEDECGVVMVWSGEFDGKLGSHQIEKFDLIQQIGQIYWTTPRDVESPLKLSEYGSYVAFAEHNNRDTRICVWKTDGSDDISIPLDCAGEVKDLDLAGESARLVAVATKGITILSIPSGDVQRTLYYEGAEYVRISRDGSFLASRTGQGEARLWSITQGTLLATFKTEWRCSMVFSRTNRLYVAESESGKVYDASGDPNNITIQSFSLPFDTWSIFPMPDESRILIEREFDIQVWPMGQFTDTRCDGPCYNTEGVCFSDNASLLALATETGIEIWDARIGQCLHVIQSRSRFSSRSVAFSPKGELLVSDSVDDGIIVIDVRTGVPLRTTYSRVTEMEIQCVEISFDSSKLAAYGRWRQLTGERLCVWDLPTGTLLHSLDCDGIYTIQWSWTDQYLLFEPFHGNPRYLNAETFQEEVLEHPGDRFQRPNNHLYWRRWIQPGAHFAFPSNFEVINNVFFQRDRACAISRDGDLLLLDTSGLEAYQRFATDKLSPG